MRNRKNHQRPTSNNPAARLRRMTLIDAANAGYQFRWNTKRRCLNLKRNETGWRSVREMADYNRRIEWTDGYFKRFFANLK